MKKDYYFHSNLKGCKFKELRDSYFVKGKGQVVMRVKYECLKHDKIVCRCGWEVGMHYGTLSRALA